MSTPGIPAKIYQLIDVPEPQNYNVSFVYFGYEVADVIADRADTMEVTVSFDRVNDTVEFGNALISVDTLTPSILGEDWVTGDDGVVDYLNRGKFLDESVMINNYTNIMLQDYFLAEKAVELVSAAAAGINVDFENLAPIDGASAIIATLESEGSTSVGNSVHDEVLAAILQQSLVLESAEPEGTAPGELLWGALAGVQHMNGIDSRVVKDVARTAAKNPFGAFSGNISYMIEDLTIIQDNAIAAISPGTISDDFYMYGVEPIYVDPTPPDEALIGEAIVVGYLIEKSELTSSGEVVDGFPVQFFIKQDPTDDWVGEVNFVDEDVQTAASYVYSLSTIAIARLPSTQYDEEVKDVDVVLKSRVQTSLITTGMGYPPPPTDISFSYDSADNRLHIGWDYGAGDLNTTKFQIFKRDNIKQPFSLIRQYDFDVSGGEIESVEDVDFGLDVKLDQPLFYYIDEEFVEGKEYIYALCSLNSGGASSPYSDQYIVKYDTVLGELQTTQLSVSGAPKPYPNFYLEQVLTKNVGKVSDVSSLGFYFTPEVYNVTKNSFNEISGDPEVTVILDFLKEYGPLTNTGKYFLELTELGVFQQAKVAITLASDDVIEGIDEFGIDVIEEGLILNPG